MENLVKAALEQNKNPSPDQQEDSEKKEGQSGEFGAPVCAVIGCGTDEIECANQLEAADLSIGVSPQQGTDLPTENVDTVISTVDPNVPPLTDRTESPQLQNRSQSSQGNGTDWMPNRVETRDGVSKCYRGSRRSRCSSQSL